MRIRGVGAVDDGATTFNRREGSLGALQSFLLRRGTTRSRMARMSPCYKATGSEEAALIASRLEGSGIRAKIHGQSSSVGFGEPGASALMVDRWVADGRVEDAKEVIQAHLEQLSMTAQTRRAEDWTCSACGESCGGGLRFVLELPGTEA